MTKSTHTQQTQRHQTNKPRLFRAPVSSVLHVSGMMIVRAHQRKQDHPVIPSIPHLLQAPGIEAQAHEARSQHSDEDHRYTQLGLAVLG